MAVAGQPLSTDDAKEIIDAVATRQHNFREEPVELSLMLVLMNIGTRYASVSCTAGEWVGKVADVAVTGDVPTCPNGHSLYRGAGLTLGWLSTAAPQ